MNIKNTYFGFTDNLKPMQKAKVENILDGLIRYACHILEHDHIDTVKAEAFITEEYNRIEAEKQERLKQEQKERQAREEQKQREQQGRDRKRLERLNSIQKLTLALTKEELSKINNITDYVLNSYAEFFNNSHGNGLLLYHDIMRFIVLAKLYPESAIANIKSYYDLVKSNSDNPNKDNEQYKKRCKIDIDVYKQFFGITDNMPNQTIRALLKGDITEVEAHNRMGKNEQRKAAQEEKMQEFYRYNAIKGQFVKCEGERITIEGYIVYGIILDGTYHLIEEQTGITMGKGNNKTEAKQRLTESIKKHGKERVDHIIKNTINKYGLSPLLQTA